MSNADLIAWWFARKRQFGRWGRGWRSWCPANDHEHPSFYIAEQRGGRLIAECYTGCTRQEIYDAILAEFPWVKPKLKYEDSRQGRLDLTRLRPIVPVPR